MTDTGTSYRPRRSCLFMPGNNARAIAKAASLPADVIVLDLEDAVAPGEKAGARERACEAVRSGGFGPREVVLRINALETPWGADDLRAAAAARPDAILVPKVSGAAALVAVEEALATAGAADDLGLWAMIETPAGVLASASIASLAERTRLTALVVGTNDLSREMRLAPAPHRRALHFALSTIVTAARATGLLAIDGVFNAIGETRALRVECREGREFGFDGKSLIHPSQIEAANQLFAPDEAALEQAQTIIAAYEVAEREGRGVIEVSGRMVERLHVDEAQRLVAIAAAIRARS